MNRIVIVLLVAAILGGSAVLALVYASNFNHCLALHPSGVTLTQVIRGCSS